jgi:hypothetical protein
VDSGWWIVDESMEYFKDRNIVFIDHFNLLKIKVIGQRVRSLQYYEALKRWQEDWIVDFFSCPLTSVSDLKNYETVAPSNNGEFNRRVIYIIGVY